MIKRLIEIANPATLRIHHRQLVVERRLDHPATVPIEDIGVVIIDHPEVLISAPTLIALAEAGAAVVVCGAKHLPVFLGLPMAGHTLHAQVISAQVDTSKPRAKRLWQAIVQAKIAGQSDCLTACGHSSPVRAAQFTSYIEAVRSGDPENIEAQAARYYWPLMFGKNFLRDHDAEFEPGINAALNYGYAVVRAAVARAIVGSGLHPALGIHHCNQYNPFALADDLMESLRPAVDVTVFELWRQGQLRDDLERPIRAVLIGILTRDIDVGGGRKLPFLVGLPMFTAAVVRWLAEEDEQVPYPPRVLLHQMTTESSAKSLTRIDDSNNSDLPSTSCETSITP
jgi:CRISPR-associated protein Cas1